MAGHSSEAPYPNNVHQFVFVYSKSHWPQGDEQDFILYLHKHVIYTSMSYFDLRFDPPVLSWVFLEVMGIKVLGEAAEHEPVGKGAHFIHWSASKGWLQLQQLL